MHSSSCQSHQRLDEIFLRKSRGRNCFVTTRYPFCDVALSHLIDDVGVVLMHWEFRLTREGRCSSAIDKKTRQSSSPSESSHTRIGAWIGRDPKGQESVTSRSNRSMHRTATRRSFLIDRLVKLPTMAILYIWALFFLTTVSASPRNSLAVTNPVKSAVLAAKNAITGSLSSLEGKIDGRFRRLIGKTFDDGDINKDGKISLNECNDLVLRLYIHINRQAPIPPPSRSTVRRLFQAHDDSGNGRISRDEFTDLARMLGRRALVRLVAHTMVTLVCAPLLAECVVRELRDKLWLPKVAKFVVPQRLEAKILPIVTSQSFCLSALTVSFVSTLGNMVTGTVNWVLANTLPPDEQ
jgi:Ca2+-binding EF-hand superfamily protein